MKHKAIKLGALLQCQRLQIDEPGRVNLARALFATLIGMDPSLEALFSEGIGSADGDEILAKWTAHPDKGFLGLEVLEKNHQCLWEFGLVPLPDQQTIAFRRSTWQALDDQPPPILDALWETHIQPVMGDAFTPRMEPTFLAVLAASNNPAGINVLTDDTATMKSLQGDIDYWKGLATETGALLKKEQAKPRIVVSDRGQATAEAEPPLEWALSDMGEWAALHSERIIILPRAIAAAKRSHFEDPALVYRCLELLANEYTRMKRGEGDRHSFKAEADKLGLAYGGSVEPSVAGESGEQYFVRWRGRRRFLDQHVTKGSSRDPRFSMRIYHTWDDELQQVVVGWLPSHLSTSTS